MKYIYHPILFFVFAFLINGCSSNQNTSDTGKTAVPENEAQKVVQAEKGKTIFYYLPTPVEMSTILQRSNASFYGEFLTPMDDLEKFSTASGQALALGLYGVDLGYAQVFEQKQEAIKYLTAVKKLTRKLGIPVEQTNPAFDVIQEGRANKEIIISLMSETFNAAHSYLKDNNRANTASLILLGGWIEALYLSTNIYQKEPTNGDILNTIAEQKYSLNTIVELVSHNQYDADVAKYLDKLLMLQKIYKNIEINYQKSDVNIDTMKKVITLNSKSDIKMTKEQLNDITKITNLIRKSILQNN